MRRILIAAFVAATGITALALAQQFVQPPQSLIGLQTAVQAQVSPAARAQLTQLGNLRTTRSLMVTRVQAQTLHAAGVGSMIALNVAPNLTLYARALGTGTQNGLFVWHGEVQGTGKGLPPGLATLVVGQNGGVTGSVQAPDGRMFRLRPLADGSTAIVELNYSALPADEPPEIERRTELQPRTFNPALMRNTVVAPRGVAPAPIQTNPDLRLRSDTRFVSAVQVSQLNLSERYRIWPGIWQFLQPPTIDVLVAYTPSVQAIVGDMNSFITLAVAESNQSFVNSNVWASIRLVGTMPVSFNENGVSYESINARESGAEPGFLADMRARRDALHADVVVLLVNQPDWCGRADSIGGTADHAFVAVYYDCATGYYSFIHEIGHIVGLKHDPAHDPSVPFPYGHGHEQVGGGWRTIMAYACGDGSCNTRLQYWSSPLTTWGGVPMGNAASEDNHRVWNERAPIVAAFR